MSSSHEIVAYLMIAMNYQCAMKLKENETGIFRSSKYNSAYVPPEKAAEDIQKFLKLWNSYGGKYCKYENIENHEMLDIDAYVHATSPIRRLVDLLLSIELQKVCNMTPLSDGAYYFYNKWTSDESITYINNTMRSIRRVQNDCSLLNLCVNNKECLDKVYEGYIFDKIIRNDKLYQYPYCSLSIYLTVLNFLYHFYTHELCHLVYIFPLVPVQYPLQHIIKDLQQLKQEG